MRISPYLNLGMASPHYISPAPDWPSNYELTGFTHWENTGGLMPAEVDEFLDAGEPPLLITLGTLAAAVNPERFHDTVDAADALGLRTLALCSTDHNAATLAERNDAAQHLAVPFAPLSRVLPRVRAVVHSGSHGTNSMTLAAGLPSVIMASVFDQVWHARRQEQLGTGVHVPKGRHLGEAIKQLMSDTSMTHHATALAERLATEDGVAMTTQRIEDFLHSSLVTP